jgi:hypothetical protein
VRGAEQALVRKDFTRLGSNDGLKGQLEVFRVEALFQNGALGLLYGALLRNPDGFHSFDGTEGISHDLTEARGLKRFLKHPKNLAAIHSLNHDWKVGSSCHQDSNASGLNLPQA